MPEPQHNPEQRRHHNLQDLRQRCGKLVNDTRVQLFIVALIAVNAIMMGIATFDFVKDNDRVENTFEWVDFVFLLIFTIELAMQFFYYGWKLLLDGWLVFDLVIIVTSWSFSQIQIIRAFRIFRALRLITRIKVMKNLVLGEWNVRGCECTGGVSLVLRQPCLVSCRACWRSACC